MLGWSPLFTLEEGLRSDDRLVQGVSGGGAAGSMTSDNDLRAEILKLVAEYHRERFAGQPVPAGGRCRCTTPAASSTPQELVRRWSMPAWTSSSPPAATPTSSRPTSPTTSACATALLVNSGSSANLVALTALTSPKLGERRLQPGRRGHHRGRGLPHHGRARSCRTGWSRSSWTSTWATTPPSRPASKKPSARRRGRSCMAHTLGVPFDLDTVMRLARDARPVADRGQLRRARLALPRPADRHLRRPGDRLLLPRPPHHHGRGRLRADRRRSAGPHRPLGPRLGPRLLLRRRREQHLRQALRPAVRQPAASATITSTSTATSATT